MRGASLCTVSAPLAACNLPPVGAASLPPSARFLALHLLTSTTPTAAESSSTTQQQQQQTLYFIVEAKSRVKEVYSQTCLHFAQQGMVDTDLFGLALICDGEYLFAEPDNKLSKYAPKSWRSSHTHGLDANGRPALAFYFRVQFYVDSPLLLRDEITRHHYYLQVRENAATRTGAAAPDHALMLAGLALQADLGDKSDVPFRPEDYVPPGLRTPWGIQMIEQHHNQNRGISRSEAEMQYIQEVCNESINAHVFRLRVSKQEVYPGSILLAVCAHGVKVYPDNNPVSTFLWGSIGKLSFEKKKFEIRTAHEKLTLFTSSDEKSKLLLALCRYTHQFSMAMAPRLSEVKKESTWCLPRRPDQRVSVISSTSSNTTSGIVSDRVQSEDELEILINSPPAQSTESLALAHLIDSSIEDLKTIDKKKGSQCSSSCSTVVTSKLSQSVDQIDSVFRDRSNSNISSVDSFRGDGTDPTETKQVLSAQELSNLIVGGKYPSHQTVSHTLDSDSDYVTISSSSCGFPPIPPKRFDSKYSFLDIAESVKTRNSDPPPYSTRLDNLSWYAFSSPSQSFYDGVGPPPYPSTSNAQPPPIPPKNPKLYIKPPPPPPQIPRLPPPPPPGVATVYTKQLSQSQIDQYQQQMHSDVDFVIFPLKEPQISKQEYLDSKHLTQYRSTPYLNLLTQKSTKYASTHNLSKSSEVIDIRTLREKSKNLDLPLISALCNDRSLLKQTKAFVMPKHPVDLTTTSSPKVPSLSPVKLKYPVSGFNNIQLSKKLIGKGATSHRHPSDKLPDIPRAAPNQYVTNQRLQSAKHKAIKSQLSKLGTSN